MYEFPQPNLIKAGIAVIALAVIAASLGHYLGKTTDQAEREIAAHCYQYGFMSALWNTHQRLEIKEPVLLDGEHLADVVIKLKQKYNCEGGTDE